MEGKYYLPTELSDAIVQRQNIQSSKKPKGLEGRTGIQIHRYGICVFSVTMRCRTVYSRLASKNRQNPRKNVSKAGHKLANKYTLLTSKLPSRNVFFLVESSHNTSLKRRFTQELRQSADLKSPSQHLHVHRIPDDLVSK
jgi:hypothetical protein